MVSTSVQGQFQFCEVIGLMEAECVASCTLSLLATTEALQSSWMDVLVLVLELVLYP